MKVALIADTHSGIRGDSLVFHDKSKLFYDDVFFPYLRDHKISAVVHLGDLVDRRKYINFVTAKRLRCDLIEPLHEMRLDTYFIAGNHDCTYKSTNEVNALRELLLDQYNSFRIIDMGAECVSFEGLDVLMIPWICDENRSRVMSAISESSAQVAFGHLELQGFEMFRGTLARHGDSPRAFEKFDVVCSGHYHHKSTRGNVHYLGSHAEFTWADYDDERGFHVFDTDTRELEFIRNPHKMFRKFLYDDCDPEFVNRRVEWQLFRDSIVKVVVRNKTRPDWFDKFIEGAEREDPVSLQVVEDHMAISREGSDDESIDEAMSTLDICFSYIDEAEVRGLSKDDLKVVIADIYRSAQTRMTT